MVRAPLSLLVMAFTIGCSNQHMEVHPRDNELTPINPIELKKLEYAAPEIQQQFNALVHLEQPRSQLWWRCGIVVLEEAEKKTIESRFRIVGMTERFVPLTGERKSIVLHLQMSPLGP